MNADFVMGVLVGIGLTICTSYLLSWAIDWTIDHVYGEEDDRYDI